MLNDLRVRFPPVRIVAAAAAAGAAVASIAGFVTPPRAAADATAPCSLTQMTAGSQPACWRPFDGGPFNTVLSSDPPLASNSAAVVAHMNHYGWTFGPTGGGLTIRPGSRPVYFASPSDPTMKIVCKNDFGAGSCTGANGVNVAGKQINVPRGAAPQSGSDAHLTVIETATGAEYDFWDASIQGSTITAGDGSVVDVDTGTGLGANGDAANFALTAGLLRPSELASGEIDHALAVTVPCTSGNGPNVGFSWPASGGWGEACGDYWSESTSGAPGLGQLLRLNMTDQQIAGSSAPGWEKTIMTALSHYGAYIEDTDGSYNSGIGIIVQDPESWTDLGAPDEWASTLQQFGGSSGSGTLSSNVPISVSDLQVVNACVPQGTCAGGSASSPQHPSRPPATTPEKKHRKKHRKKHTKKHTKHRRHAHHHKRHRHHRKHSKHKRR
jgi:hypothetical protein